MTKSREPYNGIDTPLSYAGAHTATLLAALYNNATSGGMGLMHYTEQAMTTHDAQRILTAMEEKKVKLYFGYINGRSLKIILDDKTKMVTASKYGSYNGIDTQTIITLAQHGRSERIADKFDPAQSLDIFLSTTGSTVQKDQVLQLGITQQLADALEETVQRKQAEPRHPQQTYSVEIPNGYWKNGSQVFKLEIKPPLSWRARLNQLLPRPR